MNLVMDVLRLIAVRAIRGRTWAGEAVFDSPASPGDIRIRGSRVPFISVYVDEQDIDFSSMGSLTGVGEDNTVRLVVEVGVASAQKFNKDGGETDPEKPMPKGGSEITQLDGTDEGLEMTMGLIANQALDALTSTAISNPWAAIFNGLTASMVKKVDIRRGGPPNDSNRPAPRYASRVMIMHMGTLCAPPRGVIVNAEDWPFWNMFFEACEGDAEYKGIGELIRNHIEKTTGALPPWRIAQKLMGVPAETIAAIGLSPVLRTDDEVAVLADVKIEGSKRDQE